MAATDEDGGQSPAAPPRVPAAEPLGSDLGPLIDRLAYPSEDDREFDIVDWPAGPIASHVPTGATVKRLTPAEFFDPLRDTTDAERFDALHRALAAHLSDLAAYRASDGTAEVHIYVVGRTRDGRWAGVHTTSVET